LGDSGVVNRNFLEKIKKKAVTKVVFRTSVLTEWRGFGTKGKIAVFRNNRFQFVDDALLARGCRT